jgi:hypothetical protein
MSARDQIRGLKLVVGDGPAKPGANMAMALRMAAHARAHGCRVKHTRQSRTPGSSSAYLTFTCPSGKEWKARISNHHRPQRACIPNFDLVTRDGVRGEEWLADCIAAAAVGGVEWFDSETTARAASACEQKLIAKSKPKSRFSGRSARHLPC